MTIEPLRSRVRLASGVELAYSDWGGDGPLVVLHHASGFCGATWNRIARALRDRLHLVALDARGHGDSSKPASGYSWSAFAEDLSGVCEHLVAAGPAEAVALTVGHSLGGTASLLSAMERPHLHRKLLLLDPVVVSDEMAAGFAVRRDGSTPVSIATCMRQAEFDDREDAAARFRRQPLYARFHPEVLGDYVASGLAETQDGTVTLKCPPQIEAKVYALGATPEGRGVSKLRTPTLLLSARGSRFGGAHEELARRCDVLELRPVPWGHLMAMEEPDAIAELIAALARG